jgi:hypothetical protein
VGVNPGGSEAWAWQNAFASAAYVGAPPDEFNPVGQDWGLPPLVPHRLREAAYVPFIAMLRANMRHCGALRIDHVMGLARLFWVPVGRPATEGAYVNYALEDLLAIVALESQRNRCMVIGEDLGTVPDGFRPRLATAGVLSYRPFLFERSKDGNFKPPGRVSAAGAGRRQYPRSTDLEGLLERPRYRHPRGAAAFPRRSAVRANGRRPRPGSRALPDGAEARGLAARGRQRAPFFGLPRSRRTSQSPSTLFWREPRRSCWSSSPRTFSALSSRPICPAAVTTSIPTGGAACRWTLKTGRKTGVSPPLVSN